jgi:ATP-dependent RNA helicase RhlE
MSFEQFNLDPAVLEGVRALGYTEPTPIQLEAIPVVMKGRDVIGLAHTGTGKTAAFALPILHKLMRSPKGTTRALIISPTRELAEQTCEAFNDLGQKTGVRCVAVYGGTSMEPQSTALRAGAEIVAACPGRLLDHLWKGTMDLSHLEVLVIDEADRMFDMGFLPDIKNILKCIMNPRQTLLFSATMPPDIRKLVVEILRDPVTVKIGESAPVETVSHAIYPVEQHRKTALLMSLLRQTKMNSCLIFTRTKHRAERLVQELRRGGYNAAALQGNMEQNQRQAALEGFKNGTYKFLVATDIAARGLDVLRISHVINFDMPDSTDSYTHRIGRTGRINHTGEAFTFVTGEDSGMLRSLERIFKVPIERRTLAGFDYNTPAPPGSLLRGRRPVGRRPSVTAGSTRERRPVRVRVQGKAVPSTRPAPAIRAASGQ